MNQKRFGAEIISSIFLGLSGFVFILLSTCTLWGLIAQWEFIDRRTAWFVILPGILLGLTLITGAGMLNQDSGRVRKG